MQVEVEEVQDLLDREELEEQVEVEQGLIIQRIIFQVLREQLILEEVQEVVVEVDHHMLVEREVQVSLSLNHL
tara:strand:- start:9 stop:227 length:219 start_codon:yes stop_codon:yes gene_type:complete